MVSFDFRRSMERTLGPWTCQLPSPAFPQRNASRAQPPFVLVADDMLAHLLFLPEAFRGPTACSWEGGVRAFLFDVTGAGQYLVNVDPSEGGLGVTVQPFDPAMPSEARPADLACTILCAPVDCLTMLAGGAAELTATNVQALQQFLKAFDFGGYAAFCERRHLRPWVPPKEHATLLLPSTDRISRSLGSLTIGMDGARRRASSILRASFASSPAAAEEDSAATDRVHRESRPSVEDFEDILSDGGASGGFVVDPITGQERTMQAGCGRMRSVSEEGATAPDYPPASLPSSALRAVTEE